MQIKYALVIMGMLAFASQSEGANRKDLSIGSTSTANPDSIRTAELVAQASDLLYKDPIGSITLLDSAFLLFPQDTLTTDLVKAMRIKGIALAMTGESEEGLRIFHIVRRFYDQKGDKENLARATSNLASVHRLNGRTDSTCFYMLESLHHVIQLHDTAMLISDYSNLAGFFLEYDDMDRAQMYVDACLNLEAPSGLFNEFATTYQIKGYLETEAGRYSEAEKSFLAADERARSSGDERLRANLIRDIAAVRSYTGQEEEARDSFEFALERAKMVGVKHHVAGILNDYALFEARMSNLVTADSLFNSALVMYDSLGSEMDMSDVLLGLGKNELERGNYQNALDYASKSLRIAEKSEAVHRQVACLELLTSIARKLEDEEAIAKYDQQISAKLQLVQDDWDLIDGVMQRLEVGAETQPEQKQDKPEQKNQAIWVYLLAILGAILLFLLVQRSQKKAGRHTE